MPSFRDDHIIVIQVGSLYHRAVLGLAESLGPPTIRVRTRVGKNEKGEYMFSNKKENGLKQEKTPKEEDSKQNEILEKPAELQDQDSSTANDAAEADTQKEEFSASFQSDCNVEDWEPLPNEIQPIQKGYVVDWDALRAFWKHLYSTILSKSVESFSQYPVCLLIPTYWSFYDRELATQFFFEELHVPAFTIGYESLMGLYAIGVLHGLVIDVGYEKTDITPILDGQILFSATQQIPLGGRNMTLHLQKLMLESLPTLQATGKHVDQEHITELLAEQVKCSEITQVLREEQDASKEKTKREEEFNTSKDEEGVEDIGKIVATGQTRAYLARKEEERKGNSSQRKIPENSEVEFQTINLSPIGDCIIGRERFKACQELFHRPSNHSVSLPEAIYLTIKHNSVDYNRRNDLWENIIVMGCGSRIRGFREALVQQLQFRFQLTGKLEPYYVAQGTDSIIGMTTNPPTPYPPLINPCKTLPDYFPSWKPDASTNAMFEELAFLGGSIVAKTSFNESVASHYVTFDEYVQNGPTEIHSKQ
ncbi:SWI/SNF and RSC complex subunit Arp9 [Schizosaccharomyces cryophilus OY26]|uniref:SWI/SNF and RSC complex subunit Arp9 n=1 Tax=Schizosaccharomyces cryophilus (strain OY26 / ATCC MYA-4695 / CBS 11777 / NBRC 106824 / NRRL Y48691) TaxID=653667 RepID=S9W0E4_SCHCR|nr:SWI/SNF and RSC complex subunit Arp9 [Schizosaccharomyces cryophilus OY26]EPY51535.1 SWI/SNF and RSC complex subunit Arp9 [Schizosaccharomyces cryophilus OY26]